MNQLSNIQIAADDLVMYTDGNPMIITDSMVLAKDLSHRLRESGPPVRLVGERSGLNRAAALVRQGITLLIEEYGRVIAGLVVVDSMEGEVK